MGNLGNKHTSEGGMSIFEEHAHRLAEIDREFEENIRDINARYDKSMKKIRITASIFGVLWVIVMLIWVVT